MGGRRGDGGVGDKLVGGEGSNGDDIAERRRKQPDGEEVERNTQRERERGRLDGRDNYHKNKR